MSDCADRGRRLGVVFRFRTLIGGENALYGSHNSPVGRAVSMRPVRKARGFRSSTLHPRAPGSGENEPQRQVTNCVSALESPRASLSRVWLIAVICVLLGSAAGVVWYESPGPG